MAGISYASNGRAMWETPTWAVAIVCAVIVVISAVLEKGLYRLGQWFTARHKKALFEALVRIKDELMILGFLSLLLNLGEEYIGKICISYKVADTMLPCPKADTSDTRRLLAELFTSMRADGRILAGAKKDYCPQGKVSLITSTGVKQLDKLIFFLAVFHVICTGLMMALGRAKIRGWKEWENETHSVTYQATNDPTRFRFANDVTFVRDHASIWNRRPLVFYIACFFRQFFRSVEKADYLTLRHGFISVHLAPGSQFDFQKYIKRSLEDDFTEVVGISSTLWVSAVIFMLLNVNGWHTLIWVSLFPVVIILAIGTKLQAIMAKMALEIQEKNEIVRGMPQVQPNDSHFWFGRPRLVLFLIHFSVFQNAFQIVYFFWIWYEFGLDSCFLEKFWIIVARVILGVGVQLLCSYIALPLYALVTQMGSHMKKSIFDEQTAKALKKWRQTAKKKKEKSKTSGSEVVSPASSAPHLLHRLKTTGHSADGAPSGSYSLEHDGSDLDVDSSPTSFSRDHHPLDEVHGDAGDFSFSRH
ncbi:hypothetical protein AMTRI_Chr09g33660 [Amborella trichopoda]